MKRCYIEFIISCELLRNRHKSVYCEVTVTFDHQNLFSSSKFDEIQGILQILHSQEWDSQPKNIMKILAKIKTSAFRKAAKMKPHQEDNQLNELNLLHELCPGFKRSFMTYCCLTTLCMWTLTTNSLNKSAAYSQDTVTWSSDTVCCQVQNKYCSLNTLLRTNMLFQPFKLKCAPHNLLNQLYIQCVILILFMVEAILRTFTK